jgi:hypothetical protein
MIYSLTLKEVINHTRGNTIGILGLTTKRKGEYSRIKLGFV